MIDNIKKGKFNRLVNGKAKVNSFTGASTDDLLYHIVPPLKKDKADIVILHIGTNNVDNWNTSSPSTIGQSIIELGKTCQTKGVNYVGISSIIRRKNKIHLQKKINEVNLFDFVTRMV